jgi:hypothetical protein
MHAIGLIPAAAFLASIGLTEAEAQPTAPVNITGTTPIVVTPPGASTAPRVISCPTCGTGSGEWTAGTVTAVGAGLAINSGTINASGGAGEWTAGTVTAVGTGLTITAGNTLAINGAVPSSPTLIQLVPEGTTGLSGAATVGNKITVTATPLPITDMILQFSSLSNTGTYVGVVASINSGGTVQTILATTTINPTSTIAANVDFNFFPAVTATANEVLFIGCTRTDGGTAYVMPLTDVNVTNSGIIPGIAPSPPVIAFGQIVNLTTGSVLTISSNAISMSIGELW